MFGNLKKTIALNKKNFDHIEGRRFYYSPQTTWLSVIVLSMFLLVQICFFVIDPKFYLICILGIPLFSYGLFQALTKLLFRNPVLIIHKNMLFYTKNEKWYDLLKCRVDERFIGKTNYYMTLCVDCEEDGDSFKENYWYIEYDDDLKRMLKRFYR